MVQDICHTDRVGEIILKDSIIFSNQIRRVILFSFLRSCAVRQARSTYGEQKNIFSLSYTSLLLLLCDHETVDQIINPLEIMVILEYATCVLLYLNLPQLPIILYCT